MMYGHVPAECIGPIDNLTCNFHSPYSTVQYTCKRVDDSYLIDLKFKMTNDLISSPYELEKAAKDISKLTDTVYDIIYDAKLQRELKGL